MVHIAEICKDMIREKEMVYVNVKKIAEICVILEIKWLLRG